jgi:hypothetical protein
MQQVMQTLESVTYYRMRLVKSLYDKLGTLAAPSIASFTACDKPRNLSAQCVCPETAGRVLNSDCDDEGSSTILLVGNCRLKSRA